MEKENANPSVLKVVKNVSGPTLVLSLMMESVSILMELYPIAVPTVRNAQKQDVVNVLNAKLDTF